MTVREIKREKSIDKNLVQQIEELLNEAKNGDLKSLAIAGVYHDSRFATSWVNSDDTLLMVGAIGVLQHEFIEAEVEGFE